MVNISQPGHTQLLSAVSPDTVPVAVPPSPVAPSLAPVRTPVVTPKAIVLRFVSDQVLRLTADMQAVMTVGREDLVEGYLPELNLGPYGAQNAGVSRRHARMFFQAGKLCITDLDSTNGTRVNGQQLKPRLMYVLSSGDEVEFGTLLVRLELI